jgi:hypothetical protein
MAKKNKSKASSKDKFSDFNFLEKLLVFCALKEKSVPKESGVHFRIASKKDTLCVLFEIDSKSELLKIPANSPRPDYMAFYFSKKTCLCTIIEMKGKSEKRLEHGIEQIKWLRDKLKTEITNHLPSYFKIKFQGILLTPYNSQIPLKEIQKEKANGLIILPLQYDHKAELFPYVSKENNLTEKYNHKNFKYEDAGFIEQRLLQFALKERKQDTFHAANYSPKNREGMYVNYLLPEPDNYAVLYADKGTTIVAVKYKESKIRQGLTEIGSNQNRFQFEKID